MTDIPTEPVGSSGSSPKPASKISSIGSRKEPGSSSKISTRTEVPKLPQSVPTAFEVARSDEIEVGNKHYELANQIDGHLGHMLSRDKLSPSPTFIELNLEEIRSRMIDTLRTVLFKLLRAKGELKSSEAADRADRMSNYLVNGTMITLYKKLREIHFTDCHQFDRFAEGPRVSDDIEIPLPYACCIQQLGIVKIASMTTDLVLIPTIPSGTKDFCVEAGSIWTPSEHAECVEYAKSLGIPCTTVNLSVKIGSTWWLYRQEITDDTLVLSCPLPESNFTETGAVIHSLFINSASPQTATKIAELSPIGSENYGIMMSNPRLGISVSTFHALLNDDSKLWQT